MRVQKQQCINNEFDTHGNDSRYLDIDMLNQQQQQYQQQSNVNKVMISWKQKQDRKKRKKQIFGEHYNYNYNRPNQKMYRIQENRNTQIQRSNRILLEKIQSIFKRSVGRRNQVNSQTQSSVDISMKIRSHSNNANNTNNTNMNIHAITKSSHNCHENIQMNTKMKMKINDFVQQKLGRSSDKNGKIMGELNKGIQMARQSVRDEKIGKGEGKMNRKLVKLSQIEQPIFQKRKRIQTQIQMPKTNPHIKSKINNIGQLMDKDEKFQRPTLTQTPMPLTVKNSHQNRQRESNSLQSKDNNKVSNEVVCDEYKNIPKIVLYREQKISIGQGVYDMVMYVQGSSYVVLAVSKIDGDEFKQTITMPYRDYQQFYKNSLEQNHGNVIKYFKVCDGLLEIQGFQSEFKDLPVDNLCLPRVNSQISCEQEKDSDKQMGLDENIEGGDYQQKGC